MSTENPPPLIPAIEERDKLNSAIGAMVTQHLQLYKAGIAAFAVTGSAILAFFGLNEWPALVKSMDAQVETQVATHLIQTRTLQMEDAKKTNEAMRETHTKFLKDLFDASVKLETELRLAEINRKVCETRITEIHALQSSLSKSISELEKTASEATTISRQAKEKAEGTLTDVDSLKQKATDAGATYLKLAEQSTILDSEMQRLRIMSTEASKQMNELAEKRQEIADKLGDKDLIITLKKLSNEMFRVQSLEARIQVKVLDSTAGKLGNTEFAQSIFGLQSNLSKTSDIRDHALEFRPQDPTTIGDPEITIYSSTTGLWEPFKDKVIGKALNSLNNIRYLELSSRSLSESLFNEHKEDIATLFSAILDVRVQIIANGIIIAEQRVEKPSFESRITERGVSFRYSPIDLGEAMKDIKALVQQHMLEMADNRDPSA